MYPNNNQSILSQLSAYLPPAVPPKRKVFISYHHQDQAWVDNFRTNFGSSFEVFTDCSLDQAIDSNNLLYINRTIREDYITGTSITIVICGTDTWKRKCVDWELYSTLDKDHALLAIALPHIVQWQNGQAVRVVPTRLHRNVETGYAHWIDWPTNNPQALNVAIEHAVWRSTQNRQYKDNSAAKMGRNL
jgi:hypothetical protein